jgi:hypothetical protein
LTAVVTRNMISKEELSLGLAATGFRMSVGVRGRLDK